MEVSRLELDAIRRLIVIETTNASRLGELEPTALDPAVEKISSITTARPRSPSGSTPPPQSFPATARSRRPSSESSPSARFADALEATTFALGIHEDTGSLTYATSTQRDADALSWCLRHGARQDLVAAYLHTPLSAGERDLLNHLLEALEPIGTGGEELCSQRSLAEVRGRGLEPRAQDRRSHRHEGARAPRRNGAASVRGGT